MKIYHGLSDPRLKKKRRCLAIGIFDGVHRGHQRILRRALLEARKTGACSTLLTFHPHPQKVLSGDHKSPPVLMSLEHRLRTVGAMGFDEAVVVPFTKKFSRVERGTFLERDLVGRLGATRLAVGHDFRFGRHALGTTAYLGQRARALGLRVYACPPVKHTGRVISSTAIRRLIERGRFSEASAMLGRPVSIYGTVVRGRGRGRALGFATANLDPHHETLPPEGVYAVRGILNGVRAPRAVRVKGVVHIGPRPTFREKDKSVEAHLFGQKQSLYGQELELFFIQKLRPTRRFRDAGQLARAIRRDAERARGLLG